MAGQNGWTVVADPTSAWKPVAQPSARPAGLPEGQELPQLSAHPAVTMRGGEGNLETIPMANSQPGLLGAVQTGVHNFGARVANNGLGLLKPILHPEQTGKEILDRGAFPLTPEAIRATQYDPSGPDAGATAANVLGDIATAGLLRKAPAGAEVAGDVAQDSGAGLMNKTVGSLKSDFKRGANPGKAYLEAGGGPALSMQSLADKGAALKESVGSKIGDIRNSATAGGTKIPVGKVASVLQPPISKGIALETGPGGLGNTGSIEDYSASFRPTLKAGIANGGLTPNELQDLKGGISSNTNWSDPTQFNLKAIRQQNAGALSGLESEAIPELEPLKGQYQGLKKFAARADDRALTHSIPLGSLAAKTMLSSTGALLGGLEGHNPLATVGGGLAGLAIDSVPVKSALATGLYRGGGLLGAGGKLIAPSALLPATAIATSNLDKKKNGRSN